MHHRQTHANLRHKATAVATNMDATVVKTSSALALWGGCWRTGANNMPPGEEGLCFPQAGPVGG